MYYSQFTKATNKSKTFFWKTEQKTHLHSEMTLPDSNPGVKRCCYISHSQPALSKDTNAWCNAAGLPGTATCVTPITSNVLVRWATWKRCWKEENKYGSSVMASLILFDTGKTY